LSNTYTVMGETWKTIKIWKNHWFLPHLW
jgi:hypothetical protein